MALSPGDKLGPYEVLKPIGAGGMGAVYRAHDPRLKRDVAIKVSAAQFTERFEREAQAIAALNHPNICTLYDIGPNYLVMEFIDGTPLAGPLPLDVALRHAVQIADALSAAHAKGITHRDLKPANILVTASGIKLLDFGLALLTGDSSGRGPSADETVRLGMTMPGTILGTAAYMSPEQAEAKPVDSRADIFSFGLVLYEMLSGRRAFTGDSAIAIMAAILHKEPEPLDTTPALQTILAQCLRKSPADRFQSITQVTDALLAATSGVSSPGTANSGMQTLNVPSSSATRTPSIAVLPFANLGGDKENEYFSDGLAEEMLNFLAQIPGLKVTARTSAFAFKGKTEDIRKIGDTLGVTTILEGSVRRSGSRIRVTAQLINAQDGYHLWSQRYDREMADVFAMQDEIAQAIVSALRVKLTGAAAPFEQYKPSLPAYEALLKARQYQRSAVQELRARAKECYEQAIALDPKFALAHCEYGIYFLSLAAAGALPATQAFPIVRSLAEKALELDPFLPEGEAMLGVVAAFLENDWKEAERRFRLAMARDPVPVNVRFQYALSYLLRVDRPGEALQQIELGLREDPLNLLLQINRAACLVAAGRDEEAAEGYREALELNPGIVGALGPLATYHASRAEFDQALELSEKAYTLAPKLPHGIGLLAGLLKRAGETRRAEELLEKLRPVDTYGVPRGLAVYHWALREFDAEADWLEKAIDQRDSYAAVYLRVWYGRELRSTPRWAGLMRKLNLPES
jgi:serine/threonine protein kinase/tetratricopeptide (TPR) repeat protein